MSHIQNNNLTHTPTVTVGITIGDPYGIGPEIIIKALADNRLRSDSHNTKYIIYGLNSLLLQTAESMGIELDWHCVTAAANPDKQQINFNGIDSKIIVVDIQPGLPGNNIVPASTSIGGLISLKSIHCAIDAALLPTDNPAHIDAVVTAPISKTSWKLAAGGEGTTYPGHTELFADRTGTKRFAMMFVAPDLRVALVTTHIPLMKLVPEYLTADRIIEVIELTNETCINHFNIKNPRIAVCGLNPHASENGLFGNEENQIIIPAIKQAVAKSGIVNITGPYPPDTVFNAAAYDKKFDAVVAMYHDQGTIPIKLLARDEAVNVTTGLPIIRTSPDHGTAFDIAGKNIANPGSMIAAIKLATQMAVTAKQSH